MLELLPDFDSSGMSNFETRPCAAALARSFSSAFCALSVLWYSLDLVKSPCGGSCISLCGESVGELACRTRNTRSAKGTQLTTRETILTSTPISPLNLLRFPIPGLIKLPRNCCRLEELILSPALALLCFTHGLGSLTPFSSASEPGVEGMGLVAREDAAGRCELEATECMLELEGYGLDVPNDPGPPNTPGADDGPKNDARERVVGFAEYASAVSYGEGSLTTLKPNGSIMLGNRELRFESTRGEPIAIGALSMYLECCRAKQGPGQQREHTRNSDRIEAYPVDRV